MMCDIIIYLVAPEQRNLLQRGIGTTVIAAAVRKRYQLLFVGISDQYNRWSLLIFSGYEFA